MKKINLDIPDELLKDFIRPILLGVVDAYKSNEKDCPVFLLRLRSAIKVLYLLPKREAIFAMQWMVGVSRLDFNALQVPEFDEFIGRVHVELGQDSRRDNAARKAFWVEWELA